MPGVKGKTNNPNGRPVGVPNKISHEIRAGIIDFIGSTLPQVVQLWNEIEDPAEKLRAWTNIAEFAIPRIARQEIAMDSSDDDTTGIKIEIVKSKKSE